MFFKSRPRNLRRRPLSGCCEFFNRGVNSPKKAPGCFRIVFVDILEVTEGVQFSGVTDEDFNLAQAARAEKWPRLYFFNGVRSE